MFELLTSITGYWMTGFISINTWKLWKLIEAMETSYYLNQ